MAHTPCNRDRKERFILSFGRVKGAGVGNEGVSAILYDYGLEAFEEWAIDLMVTDLIQSARAGIKRNIENRKAYAAFARRSEQVASARRPSMEALMSAIGDVRAEAEAALSEEA